MRARHILSVGLDLGLPTGALATLAAKSSAQNAYMVSCLLASHGFVYLEAPFIVQLLPAMLAAARGAVFNGIPPYDLVGTSTGGRQDAAARQRRRFLSGGRGVRCARVILLKDVDGLYTADPKARSRARALFRKFVPPELIAYGLRDPADRAGGAGTADARANW